MAKENFTDDTGATHEEVVLLAAGVAASTSDAVSRVAALIHLNRWMVEKYEASTGKSFAPIMRLQHDIEIAWITQNGIDVAEVQACCAKLNQAKKTLAYLDGLPD